MVQVRPQEITKPFFFDKAIWALEATPPKTPDQAQHLEMVRQCLMPEMDERTFLLAASKTLTRYSILPGKTFATSPRSKDKYKVLRLVANDVVIEAPTGRVQTVNIDKLLKDWDQKGLKEIHFLDDIIETVKGVLGPVLGVFLTGALISWLIQKLSN
jgi:hypothetical protein